MTDGIFNTAIFNDDIFNTHAADGGIIISGTQSQQQLFTKRPEQLIIVQFTFRIMSHLIPMFHVSLPNLEQLKVKIINSKILREAFVFPKMDKAPIIKKLRRRMKLEFLVEAVQNRDLLSILRLLKK